MSPVVRAARSSAAEREAGDVVVGELVRDDVMPRDLGEGLVERVRDPHGCTHTAPAPVIHSGTSS